MSSRKTWLIALIMPFSMKYTHEPNNGMSALTHLTSVTTIREDSDCDLYSGEVAEVRGTEDRRNSYQQGYSVVRFG